MDWEALAELPLDLRECELRVEALRGATFSTPPVTEESLLDTLGLYEQRVAQLRAERALSATRGTEAS